MTVTGACATGADRRHVQLLVVVRDPVRCAARVSELLERSSHRWRGRVNAGGLAVLRRWSPTELAGLAPGARCPVDVIEAVVAEADMGTGDLAGDLATTLTLHAVCPVVIEPMTFSAPNRPGLSISIYGSPDDDVGLAEALLDVLALDECLTVTGRITYRSPAVSSTGPGPLRGQRPLPELGRAHPGFGTEHPEEVAVTAEPARVRDRSHRLVRMVHQ